MYPYVGSGIEQTSGERCAQSDHDLRFGHFAHAVAESGGPVTVILGLEYGLGPIMARNHITAEWSSPGNGYTGSGSLIEPVYGWNSIEPVYDGEPDMNQFTVALQTVAGRIGDLQAVAPDVTTNIVCTHDGGIPFTQDELWDKVVDGQLKGYQPFFG